MTRAWLGALLAVSLLGGCVEKSQTLTTAERKELERFISKTATSPEHTIGAELGDGQLELVAVGRHEEA